MIELFHFIRPYWLFALLPLFILLWLLIHRHLSSGNWAKVCDPELLPHILIAQEKKRKKWPFFVFTIAGFLAIFALAGPTWQRVPQPSFRDTSALIILLDLSRSMDATDLNPSRLVRARFKVTDLLKQRQLGETALIVYAGDAFTVTPLTDDIETIISQLSVLNTAIMPSQGSRADLALKKAADLLQQAGQKNGHILFITDGLNENRYKQSIKNMANYQISILGVGTSDGSPIPLESGGFLKDAQGSIVIPKLEQNHLRKMALLGGGIYQNIQNDDSDIKALASTYNSNLFNTHEDKNKLKIDTWRENGPWLLLFLIPLAAFGFRRGLLSVFLLFFLFPIPQQVQAWDWKSLWVTPDQQASQAFEQGDIEKSAELFNNPKWKSAAQYKLGDYEQALKSLEGMETADDYYNKGNALAQLSRYPESIEAYKKALELNPEHKDAQYNKELIEKQSEKQESQDSEKSDSKQEKSEKSQKQESDQENSEKSQKQESAQEQENSEKNEQKSEEAQKNENAQEEKSKESQEKQFKDENVSTPDELEQAKEQLLRKIIDDPGALLRRKFKYQYQQQSQQSTGEQW